MNDDLATALEAASNNAGALEQILADQGDDAGATSADTAQRNLLFAAQRANAVNAMQSLGITQQNQQNLTKLTQNMDATTQQLAQSEANLQKFVTLGTYAVSLAGALVTPVNVAAGIAAVKGMIQTLGL